jgi:hypothetical protein
LAQPVFFVPDYLVGSWQLRGEGMKSIPSPLFGVGLSNKEAGQVADRRPGERRAHAAWCALPKCRAGTALPCVRDAIAPAHLGVSLLDAPITREAQPLATPRLACPSVQPMLSEEFAVRLVNGKRASLVIAVIP